MKKLYEYCQNVRTKTTGPFMFSIDIMFTDHESYEKVLASGALDKEKIAEIYGISEDILQRYDLPLANAVKFSMPREHAAGDFHMDDLYQCTKGRKMILLDIPE